MTKPYENLQNLANALVGAKVQVKVSDPWEFAAEIKTDSIFAIIEQVNIKINARTDVFEERESILLRVLAPFAYKKRKFEFLLVSPRHYDEGLHQLGNGRDISCNFLRIPRFEAKSDDPFQADKNWRGSEAGLIGTLKMK